MYYQKRTDTTFACPVVGRRELEYRQKLHRDKIQRMTSAIDTRPPAPQPHLTLYGRDYVAKKRATTEAAFADLKMIQSIARTMTRPLHLPERKGPVSLNSGSRKQEIFRVMHENHRLLNSLETLEPTLPAKTLAQSSRWRQRYVINCSHSKRLSGEYDSDIESFAREDRDKLDKYRQSVEFRRSKRMANMSNSGSFSMPSLVPAGAGGSSASSPHPGEGKFQKNQFSQSAGPVMQQADGRVNNGAGRQEEIIDNKPTVAKRKTSFVHFDVTHEPDNNSSQPKTPHPNRSRSDSEDLRKVSLLEEASGVDAPGADRPAEVGISGGAASGTEEFDPQVQSAEAPSGDYEYEDDFDADESALSATGGAAGQAKEPIKKKETFEAFEEEEENVFEESQSATFEKSQ